MDTAIDSRTNTEHEMLVDIGVTLRRDCGGDYAQEFLRDSGVSETVIARVVSNGSVRENRHMYSDPWTSSLVAGRRRNGIGQ